MNVIFLSKRVGKARQLDLAHPLTLSLIAGFALVILGSAFMFGMQLGRGTHERLILSDTVRFGETLAQQKQQIADLKQQLQLRVDAMAMRLGEVNAHVIRLDALGKRLTEMADIDSREFNFDREPPRGGASEGEGVSAEIPDLSAMLANLQKRVDLRESQLTALENVILARELKEEIHPEGRPVERGLHLLLFRRARGPLRRSGDLPQGRGFRRCQGLDRHGRRRGRGDLGGRALRLRQAHRDQSR